VEKHGSPCQAGVDLTASQILPGITKPVVAAAARDVHCKAVIRKATEVGNVLVQSPGEGTEPFLCQKLEDAFSRPAKEIKPIFQIWQRQSLEPASLCSASEQGARQPGQ